MDPAAAARTASWYASPPGIRGAALLQAAVARWLSSSAGTRLLAFNAAPLLAGTTIAPLAHVATVADGSSGAALVAEPARLPFTEAVFDTVIAVHTLEHSAAPPAVLREIWRILAPAGDLIVVVPNRMSRWLPAGNNPFGAGRAYSRRSLTRLLDAAMFEAVEWQTVLAAPPAAGFGWIEKILARVAPRLCGVHVIRACKRDGFAPVGPVVAQRVFRRTKIA